MRLALFLFSLFLIFAAHIHPSVEFAIFSTIAIIVPIAIFIACFGKSKVKSFAKGFFNYVKFANFIAKSIMQSSLQILPLAFNPLKSTSGFVEFDYTNNQFLHSPKHLYLFTFAITITPGTIVCKIQPQTHVIQVHYLTAKTTSVKIVQAELNNLCQTLQTIFT